MKVLLSSGSLYNLSLPEIFPIAKKFSFDGIELVLQTPEQIRKVDVYQIENLAQKYEIPVYSLHTPGFERYLFEYIISPKLTGLKVFTRSYNLALELNTKIIVVHPWPALFFKNKVRINMQKVIRKLTNPNLKICMENMPCFKKGFFTFNPHPVRTPQDFKEFCSDNNIGMTLDITHCASCNVSPENFFQKNSQKIYNIHISDSLNNLQHLPLGEGNVDFNSFFKLLKEFKYDKFLTLELWPGKYKDLNTIGECYKKIVNYLK